MGLQVTGAETGLRQAKGYFSSTKEGKEILMSVAQWAGSELFLLTASSYCFSVRQKQGQRRQESWSPDWLCRRTVKDSAWRLRTGKGMWPWVERGFVPVPVQDCGPTCVAVWLSQAPLGSLRAEKSVLRGEKAIWFNRNGGAFVL